MPMIFGPESRQPFGSSAVCECNRVSLFHDVATIRGKGHHLAVSGVVWEPIEWFADEKQRSKVGS